MALGTVVFSRVEALFLHPLPFVQQERLYRLYTFEPQSQATRNALYARQYFAARDASHSFEELGASRRVDGGVLIGESGDAIRVAAASMTPNYLSVFDLRPVYGRAFDAADIGTNRVLISAALWQSRFAQAHDVLGREITVNGRRAEVIGILPRVFMGGTAVWFPLGEEELRSAMPREGYPRLEVTGRAVRGASREAINAELTVLYSRVDAPVPNAKVMVSRTLTMTEEYAGSWRGQLGVWAAIAAIIALLCAVNFATVSLARGMRRRGEIAIRAAMGASVGRIVSMLTCEAAIIAAIGGAVAVVLAGWLLGARSAWFGVGQMLVEPAITWRVMAFGLVATVLVGFVFALAPALQLAHANLRPLLSGSSQTAGSKRQVRARRGLVAIQLGLSLASIAVLASLVYLQRRKFDRGPGYDYENFVTAAVSLRDSAASIPQGGLHEFIRSLPAARAATVANSPQRVAGFQPMGREQPAYMTWRDVPADFFATLGVHAIAGRLPTASEYATRAPVMVVSQTTVGFLFGYRDPQPLGVRISIVGAPRGTPKWYTVIGVVPDARLDPSFPIADAANYTFQGLPVTQSSGTIVVQTAGDPNLLVRSLRDQLARFDAGVIVSDAATVKSQVSRWASQARDTLWSVTAVAALAFLLAVVGVYGLTSYAAEVRSREVGIHIALGATQLRVIGLMLADLTAVATVALLGGVVVGMRGVMIVDDLFRDQLLDRPMASFVIAPIVFAAVGLLLIGLAGTFVPLRRLLRQDLARVMQS